MVNNESLRRKDSYYPEYDAYTEVFDIDGLQDLLDRAIGWEKDNMIGKSGFKYIPLLMSLISSIRALLLVERWRNKEQMT